MPVGSIALDRFRRWAEISGMRKIRRVVLGGLLVVFARASETSDTMATKMASWQALPTSTFVLQAHLDVERLSAADTLELREQIEAAPPSLRNDLLLNYVYERWGELDGAAALVAAANDKTIRKAEREGLALRGWARTQPQTAWDKVLEISNRGADRRFDVEELIFDIAEKDVALAVTLFEDLMDGRACLVCCGKQIAYHALVQNRLDVVEKGIAHLAPGPVRNGLRDAYWETLGEFAAPRAIAAYPAVSDVNDRMAAQVHLAKGWAMRDMKTALQYVTQKYDREMAERAVLPMIQEWSQGAVPEDVRGVVQSLPTDLSQQSMLGVTRALARVDPRSAIGWAARVTNAAIRNECLFQTMGEWTATDGAAARAYLDAQPSNEERGALIRGYLFARLTNQTLNLSDVRLVDANINAAWIVETLNRLSLGLADPSTNTTRTFDTKAYADWVNGLKRLDAAQKAKALEPLRVN